MGNRWWWWGKGSPPTLPYGSYLKKTNKTKHMLLTTWTHLSEHACQYAWNYMCHSIHDGRHWTEGLTSACIPASMWWACQMHLAESLMWCSSFWRPTTTSPWLNSRVICLIRQHWCDVMTIFLISLFISSVCLSHSSSLYIFPTLQFLIPCFLGPITTLLSLYFLLPLTRLLWRCQLLSDLCFWS